MVGQRRTPTAPDLTHAHVLQQGMRHEEEAQLFVGKAANENGPYWGRFSFRSRGIRLQ
jgi:hypothetical protein